MFKTFPIHSLLILLIISFSSSMDTNKYLKQFNVLVNVYQKCSNQTSDQFYTCVKRKLISALDNIANYDGDIRLISDYLVLANDNPNQLYMHTESASSANTTESRNFEKDYRTTLRRTIENATISEDIVANNSSAPNDGNNRISVFPGKLMSTSEGLNFTRADKQGNGEEIVGGGERNDSMSDVFRNGRKIDHMFAHMDGKRNFFKNDNSGTQDLKQLFLNSVYKLTKNRSLIMKLPLQYLELANDNVMQEGRKKKDNSMMLVGCLMMGGTVLSLAFGSLAVLSGKALMTSMLALMMSLMGAMSSKKGHSGYTAGGTTYEVINVPSANGRSKRGRQVLTSVMQPAEIPVDVGSGWDNSRTDFGRLNWAYGSEERK